MGSRSKRHCLVGIEHRRPKSKLRKRRSKAKAHIRKAERLAAKTSLKTASAKKSKTSDTIAE